MGTNDLQEGGNLYNVQKYIININQQQSRYTDDIGLVRLNEKIQFNEKTQPIKYSAEYVGAGITLQTTGWGRLSVIFN